MTDFIWIIFSYVLGSIPFGYLITRISTGRDVLKTGWRKTSGSNVFKNIGKWQGFMTGVLDVGKGFLVVWLAKKFNLSPIVQVLSGIAAVIGNNWSIFLKFAGGRGLGTLGGAFLALNPRIFWFSTTPFFLIAIIWDASIGTILFLITAIILSVYFNQLETIGVFILISLLPIFIKRLSPIGEILKAENKKDLARNRLIFDDDKADLELRIVRLFKKLTWW